MPLVPKLNAVGYLLLGPAGPIWRTPGIETTPDEPVTYEAASEWSITNGNPNGVWSYGEMPLGFGTFSRFTVTTSTPFQRWRGATNEPVVFMGNAATVAFGVPVGVLALHPGPDTRPGVLRWTAPSAFSELTISGRFLAGDSGSVLLTIRRGTNPLWNATDSGIFNLALTSVAARETIDFCAYGAYLNGSTPIEVSITGTP